MVNKILTQLALGFILTCFTQAQYQMKFPNSHYLPENWPQHTLRLSETGTLKDIFDSDIRPYYPPNGREGSLLEFKHVRLTIHQTNGKVLPQFPVDYARITPKPSGLSTLDITGHAITLKEAREEMIKWLPYTGKTTEELDAFLANVRAKYASFDDVTFSPPPQEFRMRWFGENNEEFVVWLQKAYSEEVPLRMRLIVGWHKLRTPREDNTFYDGQIPTPEGYEPMLEAIHHGPDDVSEMMYAKGIPFSPGTGLGGSISNVIEKNEDGNVKPKAKSEKVAPAAENHVSLEDASRVTTKLSMVWIWLIGIFSFIIASLSVLLWKLKRIRKTESVS
jgi:hypothetical protein